ncbi:hypothetical protein QFZ32_002112 [Streptomyces canus]|nr:hypothetical protein [Streptomyces canus]
MSPPRRPPPPSPTRLRRTGHGLSGTVVPWLPHCWRWSCPAGPGAATTGRTSASVVGPGVAEFGGCVRQVAPRALRAGCVAVVLVGWVGCGRRHWSDVGLGGRVWCGGVRWLRPAGRAACLACRVRGGGSGRLGWVWSAAPTARRLRWSCLVWRSSVVASGRSRRVPGGGSGRVRPAPAVFPLGAGGGARGQGIRCAGSAPSRSTAWCEPLPVGGEVPGGRVQSAVHQARQSPSRPEPPAA